MDLTKSKRRNNIIIIICILVLGSIYLSTERRDIVVLNTKWQVKKNTCKVSFLIKNNTSAKNWTNITITAYRKREGILNNQVVGEKNMAIVFKANEAKKVTENILVSAKPERVTVKIWKPE